MRLWSIHPKYLDSQGLVALWRESLLAQAVLFGETKGYKNHPQLTRFTKRSIVDYLWRILEEGDSRGYNFDYTKIKGEYQVFYKIPVSSGQIDFEVKHLLKKLEKRSSSIAYGNYMVYPSLRDLNDIFIEDETRKEKEPWEKGE